MVRWFPLGINTNIKEKTGGAFNLLAFITFCGERNPIVFKLLLEWFELERESWKDSNDEAILILKIKSEIVEKWKNRI